MMDAVLNRKLGDNMVRMTRAFKIEAKQLLIGSTDIDLPPRFWAVDRPNYNGVTLVDLRKKKRAPERPQLRLVLEEEDEIQDSLDAFFDHTD